MTLENIGILDGAVLVIVFFFATMSIGLVACYISWWRKSRDWKEED